VTLNGRRSVVAEILDVWLVEDEWWRLPLARCYFRLLLADDRSVTVFEDRIDGGWYLQQYRSRISP
jgi:hypothetical protein